MPARTVSTAAGASDRGQLNSLTNLNDINRLLHETIACERSIEADLDKQLGKRTDLEREILQLNAATSEVCSLGLEQQQLQHLACVATPTALLVVEHFLSGTVFKPALILK